MKKNKNLLQLFETALRLEFPQLQEVNMCKKDKQHLIEVTLWHYSTERMNNLDDAVKSVIKKYFKKQLKYITENLANKLDLYLHEESIWVLIK